MPIEFHCTRCRLRLRTPDDTVGKQAKCPQCGNLVPIPHPDDVSAQEPLAFEAPLQPGGESAGPLSPDAQPRAEPPPVNPYVSPPMPEGTAAASRSELKRRVIGPAVGMIVGATATLLLAVVYLAWILSIGADGFAKELAREVPNANAEELRATYVVTVALFGMMTILPLGIMIGAVSMLRLKWYPIALGGTILALLPCGPCCILSLPFGLWGLMVISDITVRSAFQ